MAEHRTEHVGDLVADVTNEADQAERVRLLARLTRGLAMSAKVAGVRAVAGGRWLADVVSEVAPRIPVRDQATLRAHHPGRGDDEIAAALVRSATVTSAGVGAAAGVVAAAEWAAPPALLAVPVQLAAETLAVAAIEIKLVAELHELYGQGLTGGTVERAAAYTSSWVRQRAVDQAHAAYATPAHGQRRGLVHSGREVTELPVTETRSPERPDQRIERTETLG